MAHLHDHLAEACDCIKAMEDRIERLRRVIRTRRQQRQNTDWSEILLEIMLSTRREAVVRRELVLLQMRLHTLGDGSGHNRPVDAPVRETRRAR